MIKPFKTNFMKHHPPNANCLNACDTPTWPGGAASFCHGTIFKVNGTPPSTACALPLYIWL